MGRQETEREKEKGKEMELKTEHPGQDEFSLQNDNFAPEENSYLNERSGDSGEESNIEFSEELADGGERDEFARRQSGKSCGGL